MRKMIRRIYRHRTTIIISLIRMILYIGLALVFFGLMSIENWPLRHASRTLGTTLFTYVMLSGVMHSVYGGFAIGKKKNKPVISSMAMSTLVTDLATYLQLQIMNVNTNNNARLVLFGVDFAYLILCFVIQIVLIVFMVRIGNTVFFKLNRPRRSLLIVNHTTDSESIRRKINRFRLQWDITEIIPFDAPDVSQKIWDNETIFLIDLPEEAQMVLLKTCYAMQKDAICKAQLEDVMLSNAKQLIIDDAPFLSMDYRKITIGQRLVKRLTDIAVSGIVLIIFSPVMLLIALAIYLEDGAPIIFRQKRMTVNGRVFEICKFRTMTHEASNAEKQQSAKEDDRRITRVGHFLRRSRLDELPQLWNILRGDMTLVGPRPEMLENVEKYKQQLPAFVYREKMKAGLTGFAQIEGRYNTTPEDKLMLDLMYIENYSLWLDVKLLLRTLTVFFKSDSTAGFEDKNDNNS
ncbi:MAG: exopolysaccharide biosynthesis polyprenyl glycosylphosphotransferase [Clostridia bacterium]|nr:exopolysaccharide biosynthesis polyprenyl glycosylphosphotransferase [Clostridia bacterium]